MRQNARARIFISGRVQGVFFRQNTRKKAQELGITGWVKNLANGRVEALIEGEKDKVNELIEWTKKGSIFSRVDGVDIAWEEYQAEFDDFKIKHE